jgi:hypothetical protein
MVFGTSDLLGPDTPAEAATSKYMQSAWAAFARDPVNGLSWPEYAPEGQTLVKLGLNGSTGAVLGKGDEYDGLC